MMNSLLALVLWLIKYTSQIASVLRLMAKNLGICAGMAFGIRPGPIIRCFIVMP